MLFKSVSAYTECVTTEQKPTEEPITKEIPAVQQLQPEDCAGKAKYVVNYSEVGPTEQNIDNLSEESTSASQQPVKDTEKVKDVSSTSLSSLVEQDFEELTKKHHQHSEEDPEKIKSIIDEPIEQDFEDLSEPEVGIHTITVFQ